MKNIRLLALLLCLSMLFPLAACSKNTNDNKENPTSAENTTSGNESNDSTEAATNVIPEIGLPETNMEGKKFTILKAGWYGGENDVTDICPDSETADVINDAAYKRMSEIEARLNCVITGVPDYNHDGAVTQVQQAVMANDATYDIALIRGTNFINLLMGNSYLTDLTEVPYIDMEQPWWNKNVYEALAIGGSHYGIVGDISLAHLQWVWSVYINKDIIQDYALESPYDLVKNGTWTFDKMMEMAKSVAKDLNNDEVMDQNDLWGLVFTGDSIMGILTAAGITIAHLDEDGVPVLTIDSESNITKFLNMYSKLHDNTYSVDAQFTLIETGVHQIFTPGNSLFMIDGILGANGMRNADINFGLVPLPKYYETDEQYSTRGGKFLPIVCIPKVNEDLENTGIFLEAFAHAGRYTIVPAFYEITLKTKIARDEETAEMIDYIFNDIRHDSGEVFNFGTIAHTLGAEFSRNTRGKIVSTVERYSSIMQRDINRILEQLNK